MVWEIGIFFALLAFVHGHAAPCAIHVHPEGNVKAAKHLTDEYDWTDLANDCCDLPKGQLADKDVYRNEDEEEYDSEVINVEDADRKRRPNLYKNDSLAFQLTIKREFATKSVVVVTVVLFVIGLITTFMVCSRYRYNTEVAE